MKGSQPAIVSKSNYNCEPNVIITRAHSEMGFFCWLVLFIYLIILEMCQCDDRRPLSDGSYLLIQLYLLYLRIHILFFCDQQCLHRIINVLK